MSKKQNKLGFKTILFKLNTCQINFSYLNGKQSLPGRF